MAETILAFCANDECQEPITIDNWADGGHWNGYPLCPECFRTYEATEFYRKEFIAESHR